MMGTDFRYPLDWPTDWPRSAERISGNSRYRKTSPSGHKRPWSINAAGEELARELERLGASDCIISTNLVLRKDGMISGNQPTVTDPGIAVYFTLDSRPLVMANDNYYEPANNIRQLTIALQNLRHLTENGGAVMKERAFRGFSALPAPMTGDEPWYSVLNFGADEKPTREQIINRYRKMAKQHHSDIGGDDGRMSALNAARDEALRAVEA